MKYVSTDIPVTVSVSGIFTVLSPDLSNPKCGKGESHAFPEIFFLKHGEHRIELNGIESVIKSGEMIIYAPNSYHRSACPSNSLAKIISFDLEAPRLAILYNRPIKLTADQEKEFEEIFSITESSLDNRSRDNSTYGAVLREGVDNFNLQRIKLRLEMFLIDLLDSVRVTDVEISKKQEKRHAEYLSVIDFMKRNVTRTLTLQNIAEECLMSVSKLKLLFREMYGGGPIDCFINLKIRKAKELISESAMSITEIASMLGFNSLHYFSRQFKKVTGVSPVNFGKKQS